MNTKPSCVFIGSGISVVRSLAERAEVNILGNYGPFPVDPYSACPLSFKSFAKHVCYNYHSNKVIVSCRLGTRFLWRWMTTSTMWMNLKIVRDNNSTIFVMIYINQDHAFAYCARADLVFRLIPKQLVTAISSAWMAGESEHSKMRGRHIITKYMHL